MPKGEPVPTSAQFDCRRCGDATAHDRMPALPARYMGEKNLSPMVSGGRFDTTGHASLPEYPDMPGEADYSARLNRALARNPVGDHTAVMRSMANDAPSLSDYAAHLSKPECREVKAERKRIAKQNAQKRRRLDAAKRGENVNFRRDKCAGDPALN